jgi:hypothetical protein
VRLIEPQVGGHWFRYLTNVLDPQRLPAEYVAELYGQRWRIEDAFADEAKLLGIVKRPRRKKVSLTSGLEP